VKGFNVVYQQFKAMYNWHCQICGNCSRLKPVLRTMPQKNIPYPVTLDSHWANQRCSRPQMVNAYQGSNKCQFFSLWLDPTLTFRTGSERLLTWPPRRLDLIGKYKFKCNKNSYNIKFIFNFLSTREEKHEACCN